ncbi:MAG: DUF2797 domain-containing protein [Raoultibacter sp.]
MARFGEDHTIVLAGIGFDDDGPYLLLNDLDNASQTRFYVLGKTFSVQRLPRRRCTGSFDLATHKRQVCPMALELPGDSKESMCPACREATGFNPAFYNTPVISPQQRAYNLTPHFVYMAYFAPQYVKVGITAQTRGIKRLLEQGARAALVVGRFDNAEDAREMEARLCAQPGVYETMRMAKKLELFVGSRYDFAEAEIILSATAERLGVQPTEACLDLTPFYFERTGLGHDELQLPGDGSDAVCAGRCIGMVGPMLVFEQGGNAYVVAIKDWESYEINLYRDEIIHEYTFEPLQMSLL